jgi:hypothetical protein
MKRALLFLALSLGLKAQTLAGLQERGISLTGDWRNPILENHSGKTILATLLLQVNAKSKKMASMGFFIPSPTSEGGIKPGATKAILGNMANPPGFYTVVVGPAGFTDSPIVSAELSAVVFADGELEMRGADIFGSRRVSSAPWPPSSVAATWPELASGWNWKLARRVRTTPSSKACMSRVPQRI